MLYLFQESEQNAKLATRQSVVYAHNLQWVKNQSAKIHEKDVRFLAKSRLEGFE
jgi:hypothetical protein